MKKMRIMSIIMSVVLVLGMSACSSKSSDKKSNDKDERVEEKDDTEEETTTTTTVAEISQRTPTGTCTSDKFNDFNDMSFFYNGKKYTLGVTKLSDMVNDGVPFSNSDSDFETIVEKQSSFYIGFSFDVIPYRSVGLTVANFTDADLAAKDCVISSFNLSAIRELPDGAVTYNFPELFTKDDLINSVGEPARSSEFDSNGQKYEILTYEQASEVYMGYRTYMYTFCDGVVNTIEMSYLP